MLWQAVLSIGLAAQVLLVAPATQVPLTSDQRWQDEDHPAIRGNEDISEWNLNKIPDPNATNHLVFETVHSLLQQWPNTRMRNGHNIVPGVVPGGTLLYHGTLDKRVPLHPNWVSLDPEFSFIFCRDTLNVSHHAGGGWHLTLMTTRPLKVVYFDGSSSVKLTHGSMDTQDLFTMGRPSLGGDNIIKEERQRITYLCDWGKKFGVDGFVRMEWDFEIMLCDFTSGVSVVSFDHVVSSSSGASMFTSTDLFEVIHAGTWHNHFPGETRIQLDLPGLVSLYDTQLAPSLVPIRAGQERWDHRTINVSSEDSWSVKSRLEANLIRSNDASSGIDWKTLFQVIVDRYADRLELTRYLVNSSAINLDDIFDLVKKAQAQLRIMLTPYLLFSASPTDTLDETDLDWTIPIYELCATVHTRSMESHFKSMTDSEKLLLSAVRGTSREICRVVTKMWAAGVRAGIDPSLNTKEFPDITSITQLHRVWAVDLNRLMAWLDWSVWVKCDSECNVEEKCYLPTWPVGFPWPAHLPPAPLPIDDYEADGSMNNLALRAMVMQNVAKEVQSSLKPEPNEWIRPQPKCVRRIKPYRF